MDLTPDQLDAAGRALAGVVGFDVDQGDDTDAEELAKAVQAVADSLWPGYIGQPRQPLPSVYRLDVTTRDTVGATEEWVWRIVLETGAAPTVVARSEGYPSRDQAAYMGHVLTGLRAR